MPTPTPAIPLTFKQALEGITAQISNNIAKARTMIAEAKFADAATILTKASAYHGLIKALKTQPAFASLNESAKAEEATDGGLALNAIAALEKLHATLLEQIIDLQNKIKTADHPTDSDDDLRGLGILDEAAAAGSQDTTKSPEDAAYDKALDALQKYPVLNVELKARVGELIDQVTDLKNNPGKNKDGLSTAELTAILSDTYQLLNDKMYHGQYDVKVKEMKGAGSPSRQMLGGIMLIIGLLVLLAPTFVTVAAVLTGVAGAGLGYAGLRFFENNQPSDLNKAMRNVNTAKDHSVLEAKSAHDEKRTAAPAA